LYFADESGFVRSQPVGYTWAKKRVRPCLPFEASCNQRINVLGALRYGSQRELIWECRNSSWKKADFLQFVWHKIARMEGEGAVGELPPNWQRPSRRVILVVDNYSVHKNKEVAAMSQILQAVGVSLFYLPPYSPEMNLIEAEWRQIKYQGLPQRSYSDQDSLLAAVELAMAKRAT
jgi:putative transposase